MTKQAFAAVPLVAALVAAPLGAQVSARVHIDIPIGRQPGVVYREPQRQVIVREYDPDQFGDWDSYYDDWDPVTLYYYNGYYYDYPIVSYARPVVVFSYRNQFFFPPRDRYFDTWRRTYRPQGRIIGGGRQYRPYLPPVRRDRDDRYQYRPDPRGNGRPGDNGRPGAGSGRNDGNDRGNGNGRPQRDGNGRTQGGGSGGRVYQPAPSGGGHAQGARPGRDNGRSRPRP